jgi:hypothetical protein
LIDVDADAATEGRLECAAEKAVAIQLALHDVLELELGPLSRLDARFVEWLAEEYCVRSGVRVSVRCDWRDLLGLVLGYRRRHPCSDGAWMDGQLAYVY